MVAQCSTDVKEAPEVYGVTSRGLMPAVFVRWEEGKEVLRPVNSRREYTFSPDRVLTVADGEAAIRAQRVDAVLRNYSFTEVARGTLHEDGEAVKVFRVSHPTDPARSYTVSIGAVLGCDCPAMQEMEIGCCKHVKAAQEFVREQAERQARQLAPAHVYTSEDW